MMLPFLFIILSAFLVFANFGLAEAAITGSENFCEAFPTYPECTGWRVEPINDNFWFCAYVDLPTVCKNPPDPQKQIDTLSSDYCCRLFDNDFVFLRDTSTLSYDLSYSQMIKMGMMLDESYPLNELALWTNKDHYDFGERINVYGKFDFGNKVIKNFNPSVDVRFNGAKVIVDLPVQPNGWFAGFFHLDNPRYHTTGTSNISVSYFHTPTLERPHKITTSTYQFTTGDVREPATPFSIVLNDDKISPDEFISYHTEPKNPVPILLKPTLISRITTPDGVVFPLPTNSMRNLDVYLDEISDLRSGHYTISMTVGNFSTTETFEYLN